MRIGLILALALSLFTVACASQDLPVIESGQRYAAQVDAIEDYRLGSGDRVRLTVFNEPTLSGEFAVTASGMLSLPLIGDVEANGKAPADISKVVQDRLAKGYLREPKVNMEVVTYRPFFILGEVKSPGQYPYVSGLTVLNAIATAQGFTPRSERKLVYIRRLGSTDEEAFRLTPDLRIWPGDTVRLGERYF